MKTNFWVGTSALLSIVLLPVAPVMADDAQLITLVNELQKQMVQMQKTIDQQSDKIRNIEKREPQIQVAGPSSAEAAKPVPMSDYDFNQMLDTATGGAQKWLKDLKFSGDLRLRYDGFNYGSGSPSVSDDRNRFRYRLRYGFEKTFNQDMKAGFEMASGEYPTIAGTSLGSQAVHADPTAANTSFDNNFNFKPIYIERAYGTYTPHFLAKKGILNKTEITGGKMNNPFEKGSTDMIWDRDVKPEGVYEKADFKLLDTPDLKFNSYFTAGQFVLDEDASTGGDANLFAYQLGLNPVIYTSLFERPIDILQAFSYYGYPGYARKSNFIIGGTSLARGNANIDNNPAELDAGQFNVFESYSEVAIYPQGLPVRFHMDLAGNPSADPQDPSITGGSENFAAGFGVKLGSVVKKGDWELGYQYKRIPANAVVGAFTDSDFGDGHADKAGSVIKAAYAITDAITLNGTMFFVHNLNAGTAGVIDQNQDRFQVDLSWKF